MPAEHTAAPPPFSPPPRFQEHVHAPFLAWVSESLARAGHEPLPFELSRAGPPGDDAWRVSCASCELVVTFDWREISASMTRIATALQRRCTQNCGAPHPTLPDIECTRRRRHPTVGQRGRHANHRGGRVIRWDASTPATSATSTTRTSTTATSTTEDANG